MGLTKFSAEATGEPVTQQRIADELGVSRQLVSFALQGKGRMSDEKRQKILRFARENNYHEYSNHEARQMISRRYGKRVQTGIIAAVFRPTFEGKPLSSLPFFAPFFSGLENEAIERRLDLVLCPLRDGDLPILVRERRVDGVICLFTHHTETQSIGALSLPLVSLPYEVTGAPCVGFDDTQGIRLATQHLIELGHRHIAYLGTGNVKTQRNDAQRLAGYRQALQSAGLPERAEWIRGDLNRPTKSAGREAARALLQTHGAGQITAIVCSNDEIAMGTVEVLQGAGIDVPNQISVTGFDDISVQAGFTPALTSIAIPREQMARRAVELIYQQNQAVETVPHHNGDAQSPSHPFPVELVTRDSSAPPPISSH